jgi:hypothetical protein
MGNRQRLSVASVVTCWGHDQRMLTIDRCLHIVGGHFGADGAAHEVCFRFFVLAQFLQGFGDLLIAFAS